LDRWCERGILGLVLTVLVFGPLALGAVETFPFLVIQGLTLGVMVLWGIRLWADPRPRLLWPPITWAVLAFVLYTLGRYLNADIEYVGRQEFIHILVYTVLFLAILNNLHRQESTQIISFTLVFLAMVISLFAVCQFLGKFTHIWNVPKLYANRGTGTYICPNHLGGFLEMLLPLALAYTLVGRGKAVTRVFLGYAGLVMAAGIVVTLSGGSWVSSSLILMLFCGVLVFHPKFRWPMLAAVAVLLVAGAIVIPRSYHIESRLRRAYSAKTGVDDDLRFTLWRPTLNMWLDHPWWGVGPGHYDTRFRQYRPEKVQLSPDHAHNDYLELLADYGVAGAVIVAAAWLLLGAGVAKTWRFVWPSTGELGGKQGSNKFAFVLGATLGLTAILAHSVVDFNLHIPANAILAVALMALLTSHLRFATERYWWRAGGVSKVVLSLGLLVGAGYLGWQGWRHAVEGVWLARAEKAPPFSVAQANCLKQALAVEPLNPETARALGQAYRHQSQEGGEFYQGQEGINYQSLAAEAMKWFETAIKLNPWDGRAELGVGWCLDWLDRKGESGTRFARAEILDPNSYYAMNCIGLHYVERGDYAAARSFFERSSRLEWRDNPIAVNYRQIVEARMLEAATNSTGQGLSFSQP